MSNKKCIPKNGSSLDPWKSPFEFPTIPIIHDIKEHEARKLEKPWLEFICHLNGLAKASIFNLCAIFYRKYKLKKFKMINYETFQVQKNTAFKDKLLKIANDAETLQIVHGMKMVTDDFKVAHPEFKEVDYINCIIFVARNSNGEIIQTI